MSKHFAIALLLIAASARADFDSVVRAVESCHGLHRKWTPGISLVRFAVRMVHPDGVHDFEFAMFEGGKGDVDFARILRSHPGTPIVSTHNNRTGETAVIWARPLHDDLMEMLVVAHDPTDETVVIRAVVDGELLARQIRAPKHVRRIPGE